MSCHAEASLYSFTMAAHTLIPLSWLRLVFSRLSSWSTCVADLMRSDISLGSSGLPSCRAPLNESSRTGLRGTGVAARWEADLGDDDWPCPGGCDGPGLRGGVEDGGAEAPSVCATADGLAGWRGPGDGCEMDAELLDPRLVLLWVFEEEEGERPTAAACGAWQEAGCVSWSAVYAGGVRSRPGRTCRLLRLRLLPLR